MKFVCFVTLALSLQGCYMVGLVYPPMNEYIKESDGRAQLAEATSNRKISILEAEAKLESAKYFSAAEIERAKGVAEANKIIGSSLQNNDAYLRYLWIQNLNSGANETIYIPTEGNLPILESGRFLKPSRGDK